VDIHGQLVSLGEADFEQIPLRISDEESAISLYIVIAALHSVFEINANTAARIDAPTPT
jgi:hypothetical protein